MDDGRYSRNVALFGRQGQDKIAAVKVAIVGLGGLGSHVVQQLAYLGVMKYGLVDADSVSESSLNRVVGALPVDALNATLKVSCAERTIRSIQANSVVECVPTWLPRDANDPASKLITQSDVVFGCLDREAPRLFLTDLCSASRTTYFDLATDTGGEYEDWYGGRVVYCDGKRCLSCLDMLDQRLVRLEQMSEEELEVERRLYGMTGDLLGATGPSVVSVNGVVASLAVTEFMAHLTGIRQAAPQLIYRGDIPRLTTSRDRGREGCPYCSRWN